VTALFVALDGKTVAVSCFIAPVLIVLDAEEIVTDVTGTVIAIAHVAVTLLLMDVAVIIAVPADTAVTTPDEFTVALEEFELHVTNLFVALDGVIIAVNVSVFVG
jgi:hypothetical protein